MRGVLKLCFFLAVEWASLSPALAAERETLPGAVTPVHYDLALVPNAQDLTFRGQVTITVMAKSQVKDISLNADGLSFDRVTLDGGAMTATADQKLGREALHAGRPVTVGQHVIAIAYHGKIGRSTLGFFAMDYVGPNGPRRTLATNFEPAAARQLLPCWDEPGLKATFTITVRCTQGPHGDFEHAGGPDHLCVGDDAADSLCPDPEDVDLSAVLRHRRLRAHPPRR